MGGLTKRKINKIPQSPGTYIFKNKNGQFLYIGKAGNLRNRVRQYLKPDAQRPFLKHLLNETEKVEFKTTDSEIEALILESGLIKKHRPKYNIMLRDGKRYFYVSFSNETFPKIYITHQPNEFGPFTDGTALKTTMKILRRIFPYCTCKQKHQNFCLNYHIGKCPGFCCLRQQNQNLKVKNQNAKLYKKNINAIKDILSGKKDMLIKKLKKELNLLGKEQEFEKAIELRNKIEKLDKIFTNAKIIRDYYFLIHDSENSEKRKKVLEKLKQIFRLLVLPKRIEGYDISNIQGENAVGAMAVFSDGQPAKKEYRKFKIVLKKTPDDIAMLKEVLTRRFNHPEWPNPDFVLIDGGIGQLNAAKSIISKKMPAISLAKGKNEVFSTGLKKPVPMKKLPLQVQNLIKYIDSEAHRFAIGYYRKLNRKAALPKNRF